MKWTFLALAFALNAHAGGAVGNGGDSVFCVLNSAISPFTGWFNLDYLINKTAGVQYSDEFEKVVGPNDPMDKNLLRIANAFKERKYRVLYLDIMDFHNGLWSNQFAKRYIWKKAPYGVVEINDEVLRQRLPSNCLGPAGQGTYLQTVLRVEKTWSMEIGGGMTVHVKGADYTYATEIVSKLPSLQMSFLLFHEWLRNFTDDPEKIRDANAVFHSLGWSGEDVERKLDIIMALRVDGLQELRSRH